MSTELKVFEILTRKKYSRDEPFLVEKLKERLNYFISHDRPIKLVGFWGVGFKNHPNWVDLATCEHLEKLSSEIKKVYSPGLEFIFIFATLHGIHNGITLENIIFYTAEMEKNFKEFGFRFLYLDELWEKYGISFKKIDEVFKQKEKDWWSKVENHEMIENNARKRNQRLELKMAAQKYFIMRDLEKEMWQKEFLDFIFHAFCDSKLKNVLPNLPTLYFYSRPGWSDVPWFV